MRIFFLNPSWGKDWCRSARWAAKSRGRVQRHPDWYLTAVAYVERAGHKCKFLDAAALNISKKESLREIKQFNPEILVLHTTTPSIYNDISYAKEFRKFSSEITVLIGPHATVETENCFQIANGSLNVIVRGEYDQQLLNLANGKDFSDILGISYIKDEKIIHNDEQPPIDLDLLPFPAWHHIKPEWYRDGGKLYPFLTLLTGRGCFGKCTFCRDTQVMYGRKIRLRKPKIIVDEIEHDLKLFPQLREIMIETDTFAANPNHVQQFCKEIINRNLNITWSCNSRVDIKPELLPLMKRAGCRMLMTGFEFGYQQGLDAVKKGIKLETSKKFVKAASKLGFTIHGCFMIGAPGETKKQALQTIEFAKSLPLDTIQISGICVYPGTEMYDWAKEHNYLVPKDWRGWVNDKKEQITLLNYPQLTTQEINALIDYGLKAFYLRPKQILNMIKNVRSIGDFKRKLFGFKSFLDYFIINKLN